MVIGTTNLLLSHHNNTKLLDLPFFMDIALRFFNSIYFVLYPFANSYYNCLFADFLMFVLIVLL